MFPKRILFIIPSLASLTITLLLIATLVCRSESAHSAELVVFDIDSSIEWRPQDFNFTLIDKNISAGAAPISGTDTFKSAYGIRLRTLLGQPTAGAAWGPIYGIELAPSWATYASDSDYSTIDLRGLAGLAWQIDSRWQIHSLAYLSAGYGRLTVEGNGIFTSTTLDGWSSAYGIRCGAAYTLSAHWRLQTDIGWSSSSADLDNQQFELELDTHGLTASLGLVWRLGTTPRTLD